MCGAFCVTWNSVIICGVQIQVAHFEPDTIVLTGEGIFPCITFNVPRVETSMTEKNISAEGDVSDTATDERMLQVSFYSA